MTLLFVSTLPVESVIHAEMAKTRPHTIAAKTRMMVKARRSEGASDEYNQRFYSFNPAVKSTATVAPGFMRYFFGGRQVLSDE